MYDGMTVKAPMAKPRGWFEPTLCFWRELKDIIRRVPKATAGMAMATTSPTRPSARKLCCSCWPS